MAVEINCRPERMDPPNGCCARGGGRAASSPSTRTRTRPASWTGWADGTERAGQAGLSADRVINTRGADALAASR